MSQGKQRSSAAWRRSGEAYHLLANYRRRTLLEVLDSHDWSRTLADLTKDVAVRESDAVIEDLDAETVKRIYLALHHVHVPKLVDADLVIHDERRNTVSLTEKGTQLVDYHSDRGGRRSGSTPVLAP